MHKQKKMKNILFISFLDNLGELRKILKNQFVSATDSLEIATDWVADFDLVIFDSRLFDSLDEKNSYSAEEQSILLNKIEEYGIYSFFYPVDLQDICNINSLRTRVSLALL